MAIHPTLAAVTRRICERSKETRATYLSRLEQARSRGPVRAHLSCTNLAHAFAAFAPAEKCILANGKLPNIGIVSAYNDMLSAHQPLERFPAIIKQAAREAGASPSLPAAFRRCATASPRASPAWSCRCSAATLSPWPPPSRCPTTRLMRRFASASATRSCRGW